MCRSTYPEPVSLSLSAVWLSRHVVGMARTPRPPPIEDVVRGRVRELRLARGLTQEQLCESAGISVDAVNRVENGTRIPTLSTLARLAGALGVDLADLVRSTPPPAPRYPPAVERMVLALTDQPEAVLEAAEKIVRVLISVGRR